MHSISPTFIENSLATWGYLGIFLCIFVGNVGVPIPEETVLLVAGLLAGREVLDVKVVYVVAVLSAIAGDNCGFLLGRTGGQRVLGRLCANYSFVRDRYDRLQDFFRSHGSKAVFMARFIAGARFMAGPVAGAAGMSFWRFFGWNIFGATVWCALMVGIGYLVVDELWQVLTVTHAATRWVAVAVLILLLAAALLLRLRAPKANRAS
jgi:membrane protein DedA with SNARE-associated domain